MNENLLAEQLYSRYGEVKRARQCYLYTEKQIRLVDMYQQYGKAILGYNEGKSKLAFKNAFNRGVSGNYVSHYHFQVQKIVNQFLPDYPNVRIYSSKEKMIKAISLYLQTDEVIIEESCVITSKINTNNCKSVLLWRPWLEDAWFEKISSVSKEFHQTMDICPEVVLVSTPFAFETELYIVAYSKKDNSVIENSDYFAPPILAGLVRAFYDLYAEIPLRSEIDWNVYDSVLLQYFDRNGPYLTPKISKEKYWNFVLHCLDNHLVISPDYSKPSIIPYSADLGVFRLLQKNPFLQEN